MKNFIYLLLSVVLLTGCEKVYREDLVRYEVRGDSREFNVTYLDGNGNIVEKTVTDNAWFYDFKANKDQEVWLVGQTNQNRPGTVIVSIYYETEIIEQESATGLFATAGVWAKIK